MIPGSFEERTGNEREARMIINIFVSQRKIIYVYPVKHMSLNKRRTAGPILDNRTVENPNAPKHNNLNSPRGAALEQWDTTLDEGSSNDVPFTVPRVGRSRNVPLKQTLLNATDYSKRESERPFADIYTDIGQMISSSVNAAQLTAGTGLF